MYKFCFLATAACLALAGHARPADLTTIDRTLRKEPVYQSPKPQLCLLVFGPEATTRVWAAFDGDVHYLDRNGNGDLTEPGERIAAREVYRNLAERPNVERAGRADRASVSRRSGLVEGARRPGVASAPQARKPW